MAVTAIPADTELGWRKRRKVQKQRYKAEHKARMTALLQHTRLGYHWYTGLLKYVMLFPPCFILANFIVKGAYDWVWETGFSLLYLGIGYIAFGVIFPTWRILRARRKGYKTSNGTWIFVGFLLVIIGVSYLVSKYAFPGVATNHELWHHLAPNKEMRDDFGRNGLEGLYTGLLFAYVTWDPVKYELRGTLADRFFKGWWPNSFEDDDQRPIRAWMMWACPVMMVAMAAGAFIGFWELHNVLVSNSAAIHSWFRSAIPWHVHSSIPGTIETKVNHVANLVFDKWWIWFAGAVGGAFLARIPAKGLMNLLQENSVQDRLVKNGGNLSAAHSWWRSMGWNAHLAVEYYEGVAEHLGIATHNKDDDVVDGGRVGLSAETIAEIEAALAEVPQHEIDAASAEFSKGEIDDRDPGVDIPLKILKFASPLFFVLGGWIVYIHPHLQAIANVFGVHV